ncbi:AAA family ATPase [Arthrobacter citreus]|uniref:AAA family ATPase n=1 Tax=Arthrobacter citreus TaxID=1670 RepID=UPI0036DDCF0B
MAGLVGRDALLGRMVSALAEGRGALIVGPQGIGKSALAHALTERARGYRIEALYGTEVSRRSPYGALAALLSELPLPDGLNPVSALHEVRRLLRSRAAGLPLLLVVDDVDQLDELSVQVVAQLVRGGEVTVVATATDLVRAEPEVLALWAEGHLDRIDVEPLSQTETRTLMAGFLSGPVSEHAARSMWAETWGNPHFTTLMTAEQVRQGRLVLSEQTWVRAGTYVHSGAVAEVFDTQLSRLPADHRKLVEVLSRVSPLPLGAALGLVPAETLDALEEDGTVVLQRGALPAVVLSNSLFASVVAANIALGRSHELWKELSDVLQDPGSLAPAALAGFVSWSLDCESDPGPQCLSGAAAYANDSGKPSLALAFVGSAGPGNRDDALVLEEIRALMALGEDQKALNVLRAAETGLDPGRRNTWVAIMILKAALLRSISKSDDPALVLAGLTLPDGVADSPETSAEIDYATAELQLAEGNYAGAVQPLTALAVRRGISDRTRALAVAAAAEALAVTGKAGAALHLVEEHWGLLRAPFPAPDQSVILNRLFYAFYAAGDLKRALRFVRENTDSAEDAYHGTAGELVWGVVRAAAGESDAAIEALEPAVSQLRFRDPQDLLPLAAALLSYAHGLSGNTARASVYQRLAPRFRNRPFWHAARVTEFFRILARQGREKETAARALVQMAEEAEARGNVSFALGCYEAAASRGDLGAAAQLARLAPKATGRWAETLASYAKGMLGSDPWVLLEAAEGAAQLGHHLLAHHAAGQVRTVSPAGGGSIARRAAAVENAAYRRLLRENSIQNMLAGLSDFDARLVKLAAGTSSRNHIAQELHLSPRTVDWHLNKLFRKLHVSGRTELRDVLRSAE